VSLAGRRLRDLGELGVVFSRGSERRNEDFILNVQCLFTAYLGYTISRKL